MTQAPKANDTIEGILWDIEDTARSAVDWASSGMREDIDEAEDAVNSFQRYYFERLREEIAKDKEVENAST